MICQDWVCPQCPSILFIFVIGFFIEKDTSTAQQRSDYEKDVFFRQPNTLNIAFSELAPSLNLCVLNVKFAE